MTSHQDLAEIRSVGHPPTTNFEVSSLGWQAGGSGGISSLLAKITPEIKVEDNGGQLPSWVDTRGLILSSGENNFQTK